MPQFKLIRLQSLEMRHSIIRNPLGFSNVQTISGIIGSHEDTHVLNACLPARQELCLMEEIHDLSAFKKSVCFQLVFT